MASWNASLLANYALLINALEFWDKSVIVKIGSLVPKDRQCAEPRCVWSLSNIPLVLLLLS